MDEAILLALHDVKSRTDKGDADTQKYETAENIRLKDALLAAFDPEANAEIMAVIEEIGVDWGNKDEIYEFYRVPVMCMLRIRDSVQHWSKRMGSNGYFEFLNGYLGNKVPDDDEMSYSVIQKI